MKQALHITFHNPNTEEETAITTIEKVIVWKQLPTAGYPSTKRNNSTVWKSHKKFFLEYVKRNEYNLVKIYTDEGKSGTKMKNQVQFLYLLSAIAQEESFNTSKHVKFDKKRNAKRPAYQISSTSMIRFRMIIFLSYTFTPLNNLILY